MGAPKLRDPGDNDRYVVQIYVAWDDSWATLCAFPDLEAAQRDKRNREKRAINGRSTFRVQKVKEKA